MHEIVFNLKMFKPKIIITFLWHDFFSPLKKKTNLESEWPKTKSELRNPEFRISDRTRCRQRRTVRFRFKSRVRPPPSSFRRRPSSEDRVCSEDRKPKSGLWIGKTASNRKTRTKHKQKLFKTKKKVS